VLKRQLALAFVMGIVILIAPVTSARAQQGASGPHVGPQPVTCLADAIVVEEGTSIQAAMDAAGPGASLCIEPGIYRPTSPLEPQSGQVLTFEKGAIVSGAQVVTSWSKQGAYWVLGGQTQEFSDPALYPFLKEYACTDNPAACVYEDLFKDDKPMTQVLALADLGPGKIYFDKAADLMYIVDDPTGHTMETTRLTIGMDSTASDVTIRGATFEKFAWIGFRVTGNSWTLEDDVFADSHLIGLQLSGNDHVARRNAIEHNGDIGILATEGSGMLFDSNEVAFNNYLHFGDRPIPNEEGGAKFLITPNTTLRGNFSHDNDGDGWWFDTSNTDILVEGNTFANNARYGLFYEVSFDATIRNNTFRNNGIDYGVTPHWVGGGIRISTSKNVDIYDNLFQGNRWSSLFANWVDREAGAYGVPTTTGLHVHDNIFDMVGGFVGSSEGKPDIGYASSNNRFDNNTYRVTDVSLQWWRWPVDGGFPAMNWDTWRGLGFDVSGSLSESPLASGSPTREGSTPESPGAGGGTFAIILAAAAALMIVLGVLTYGVLRRRRANASRS
jgi:parallel beta-helix repeat protein